MSKLCSLTTPTPSPRTAAPPGKRSTVTLCTQAPKAPCDLRAMSSTCMWANPDLPFDPKNALPIRHPLLVAECRCWRPLRFSHVLTARQASTSERAVGGASSTEMGQLFQPLAVLSHHLHCNNNGLRTRKAPSHNDGLVTPHYTISLTATAEEHPNTVMSAPLRHPSEAGTEYIDTLSAGGPRPSLIGHPASVDVKQHEKVGRATAAVQLWSSPATWTSVYIRAHSPPFLQHTASQHRPAPPSHQLLGVGGGGVQRRHLCNASLQCVSSSVF